MWPALAVLAGVLANKMSSDSADEQAKKQAIANMRMQLAQRFSPGMPTFGLQAAQLKQQMDARRDEGQRSMIAGLMPIAIQGMSQLTASPSAPSVGAMGQALGAANDARFGESPVPQLAGAYQVNPFHGFEEEPWEPERPMY